MSRWKVALILFAIFVAYCAVGAIDYNTAVGAEKKPSAPIKLRRTPGDPTRPPAVPCHLIWLQYYATRSDGKPWRVKCIAADLSARRPVAGNNLKRK